MKSDFSNIPIEFNELRYSQVQILNTTVHFQQCMENHTLERLLIAENDKENADFLTFFTTNHWVVVDSRGRRDSSKAHYDNFCLDRYYHGTRHLGTIALICEQPEESYCKENFCLHHYCPVQHYFDEQKEECIFLEYDAFNDWLDEFDATKPEELDFKNITNIYGNLREHDLQCGKNDSGIIGVNLTEQELKFLPNGQLDIDGAIIPFNQHCYNLQGKLIIIFVVFTNKSIS